MPTFLIEVPQHRRLEHGFDAEGAPRAAQDELDTHVGVGGYVNGERLTPQPFGLNGGRITKDIVGPFKGEPGTTGR